MKFSQTFSAQRIIKQIFDWLQQSKQDAIKERLTDIFSDGVVQAELNNLAILGKDLVPTLIDFFHVKVDTGVAYKTGERILIANSTISYNTSHLTDTTNDGLGNLILTPHSTGSFDIPLTATFVNYLYIAYLLTTDETQFTLHKITNAKQFYKQTDGYQIVVNTTGINPNPSLYVFLGQVDLTGLNQAIASNISIVNRDVLKSSLQRIGIETSNVARTDRPASYTDGQQSLFLDERIKAVGTGPITNFNPHGVSLIDLGVTPNQTVEKHRQLEHTSGLIAGTPGTPNPVTSALFVQRIQVSPGDDYLIVKALISDEVAIVNGIAFDNTNFGIDVQLGPTVFRSGPAGPTTYQIVLDQPTATLLAINTVTPPPTTQLWLATVTWDGTNLVDGNLSIPIDRRRFGTTNRLQRWITAARPPTPIEGQFGFNMDSLRPEFYNGTTWITL